MDEQSSTSTTLNLKVAKHAMLCASCNNTLNQQDVQADMLGTLNVQSIVKKVLVPVEVSHCCFQFMDL